MDGAWESSKYVHKLTLAVTHSLNLDGVKSFRVEIKHEGGGGG